MDLEGISWFNLVVLVSNAADTYGVIPENTDLECFCRLLSSSERSWERRAGLKVKNVHHKYRNLISYFKQRSHKILGTIHDFTHLMFACESETDSDEKR